MDKICFLICQYGEEVNGGAETHCKMLAERLAKYYSVDILTSKIISYQTYQPFYKNDIDHLNGVRILRFDTAPFDKSLNDKLRKKTKVYRKFRRTLFRIGILKYIADIFPNWKWGIKAETYLFRSDGFYSEELLTYLQKSQEQYKAVICFTYLFPYTIFGSQIAPHKTILIPTAHNDSDLFRAIQTQVFTKVKHIAFNTVAEKNLASNIFGKKMSPNSIVAVGVDLERGVGKSDISAKFDLPEEYVLYFGRICMSKKVDELIRYFLKYKEKCPGPAKLVLAGRLFMPKIEHPDLLYIGFVSEAEKTSLIENARLIVNPSENESLSLLLLETMSLGKTALVNGRSEVMRQHCVDSQGAALYYTSYKDFYHQIKHLLSQEDVTINQKAIDYVNNTYSWNLVLEKVRKIIDRLEN